MIIEKGSSKLRLGRPMFYADIQASKEFIVGTFLNFLFTPPLLSIQRRASSQRNVA
jgi:hypothetical protein